MTKATKAKLADLSNKVKLQIAEEQEQGSKLKFVLIAVAGAVLVVVFLVIRKRRK